MSPEPGDAADDKARNVPDRDTPRLPGLTVAAIASIGAGVIHAAASGVHAEHPQLARLFVLSAVAQAGAGLLALARPHRLTAALIAAINTAAVAVWLTTRISGIGAIDGLQTREAPQFADTVCALMAAAAVGCALAASMIGARRAAPPRLLMPALAVAALTVPAMLSGSTHTHAHADAAATTANQAAPHVHSEAAPTTTAVATTQPAVPTSVGAAVVTTTPASTDATSTTAAAAKPWPRPWDPSQPVDLSGVLGVTPEQQARATKLVEDSLKYLPKYADPAAAIADGYASIGDAVTGDEHYIKTSLIEDSDMLDPTQPESLVYKVDGDKRILAGAMYIASARPTDDPTLTDYAGPLMQWHNHGNLCWAIGPDGHPKVVGITDANGNCAVGVNTGGQNPMVHVWIVPHPCGVFAALEGVGAGQAAVPDDQRVDLCNEPHTHTTVPVAQP